MRCPSPVLLLLSTGILVLTAVPAAGQAFTSASYPHGARAAGMAGAVTALGDGSWAGLYNPAAWARQSLLHAGHERMDLARLGSDAHLEAGVGGVSLAGIVGVGVARSQLVHGETAYTVAGDRTALLRPRDRTDVIGAAVDLGRALDIPGLELAFGASYKQLQSRIRPREPGSPVLADDEADDWDLGALVSWRTGLAGPAPGQPDGAPASTLRLSGGVSVINAGDPVFPGEDGTEIHAGRTSAVGVAVDLGLGRVSPVTHAAELRVAAEVRRLEVAYAAGPPPLATAQREDESLHLGAEMVLAGVFSARMGYVDDPLRDLGEISYGAGVQFLVPGLRIHVRGDYARVPLRTVLPLSDLSLAAPYDRLDRYALGVWIGF
ncbi:MAG: hypothetical protein R6X25_11840 [Candidatus Krumholzibacteriia bacterium]